MKSRPHLITALALIFLGLGSARAASTIDPGHAYAWSANFGWTNWLPSPADGVVVSQDFCSGYIYAANIGWINLGDGSPADGAHYSNTSSDDFGVNSFNGAAGERSLRGYGYSANVGWITFENGGNSRVIVATGQLRGFVWSANCGWINLDDADAYVQTAPIANPTPTPAPTVTPGPTPFPTVTPLPTATPTATPLPTGTPNPSATPGPTASPTPGPATGSHLANISTRMHVGTGDDVLIAGFIVGGTGPKQVIVRGIGPSLPVADQLPDPTLELYDGGGNLIAQNNDWSDSPNAAAINALGLAPSDPKEAAIIASVQPNLYTAILRGANDATGNGLMEVYDLATGDPAQLVNISSRGFVQTGDDVMIGGIIITGSQPSQVVFRALGPSLGNAGVASPLADPALELHNNNGDLIFLDNNWRDAQETALQASGLQPGDDLEAAIIITLSPGNYTAIVRGEDGGIGNALLEVYKLTP